MQEEPCNPYQPPNAELSHESSNSQEMVPAGFWIRVGASLLDYLLFVPLTALVLVNQFDWKSLPLALSAGLLWPLYKIGMEGSRGATLGKQWLKLRVIDSEGNRPTWLQATLRYSSWVPALIVNVPAQLALYEDPKFAEISNFAELARHPMAYQSWSTMASAFTIVACLVIVFSDRKRALHDFLAGTYCVRVPR